MGTVYEAKALRLNTTIALKETHFTDERLRKQFEREAQLLASLRHPSLPRVIDHFDEGDGLYLVMDFVGGEDLLEMLKSRGSAFPVDDVLDWAAQLLDALHYLHTQNPPVIHRDIKLQNLKVTDDGRIILLDFGLAKGLSDAAISLLTSKTVMGFSLPYAPLEQILQIDESRREDLSVINSQEVERLRKMGTNHRSDLYSVGATLLHLLTGKIPPNAPTRAFSLWTAQPDPLEAILKQRVPHNLWPVFSLAMALDPDERFKSANEMRKAIREATSEAMSLASTVVDIATEDDSQEEIIPSSETEAEAGQTNLTDTQKLQLEYWTSFRNFLERRGSHLNLPKPSPQHWMTFAIGRSYFRLSAFINTMQRRPKSIAVDLGITGRDAKPHFYLLQQEKEVIENEVGETLEWGEKPNNKESYIRLRRYDVDTTNRQEWPSQHAWLQEKLETFHRVFAARIKALNAKDYLRGDTEQATQEPSISTESASNISPDTSEARKSTDLHKKPSGLARLRRVGVISIVSLIGIAAILLLYKMLAPVIEGSSNSSTQPIAVPSALPATSPVTTNSTSPVAPTPQTDKSGRPESKINVNNEALIPKPQTNGRQIPKSKSDVAEEIRKIDRRINGLEEQRAALLVTYTPEWPAVKKIDSELRSLKRERALKMLEQ